MDTEIFDFCFAAATRDAFNLAYQGKWAETFANKDNTDVKATKNIVKEYIDAIFGGKKPDSMTCIEAVYSLWKNTSTHISFGNAQKWVNMTAKYFYITVYHDIKLRDNFSECHCPMDSKMIAMVYKELKNLPDATEIQKYDSVRNCKWSKLFNNPADIAIYNDFQNAVRWLAKEEGVSPLEYDYKHW